jgi:hypothetical protein
LFSSEVGEVLTFTSICPRDWDFRVAILAAATVDLSGGTHPIIIIELRTSLLSQSFSNYTSELNSELSLLAQHNNRLDELKKRPAKQSD